MKTPSFAITGLILGLAAASFGVPSNKILFTSAEAQDSVVTEDSIPAKAPEKKADAGKDKLGTPLLLNPVITTGAPVITTGGTLNFDAVLFELHGPDKTFRGANDGVIQAAPAGILTFGTSTTGPAITSCGTVNLEGAGQTFQIRLTGNTLTTASEPAQPDLSQQFLELSSQLAKLKLKRLHPQLLALEVETLKKEISDQLATTKLEEAQEQLKKIVNDHPESPAAHSARRMLETGATLSPTPDRTNAAISVLPTY